MAPTLPGRPGPVSALPSPARALVGVCRGDGHDVHTCSGAAAGVLDALERRFRLDARIDVELTPAQRAAVTALAVHPSRQRWGRRSWLSVPAFAAMSHNSSRRLAAHAHDALAVQVYGVFGTRGAPFVIYIDTTQAMAHRHWPEWSPFTRVERRAWIAMERGTYHRAAHVFTACAATARSVEEDYGVPSGRVTVVGAGANFDPLPDVGPRTRAPEILFMGREWRRKGGPELLEAFRQVREAIPGARLTVVGTTEPAAEPGVRVLGMVRDRAELAALLSASAVFCVPSRFCPFTSSLIEAMAYGLPCVSTRTAGVPELVLDGTTGLLVDPYDTAGLAAALRMLLDEPAMADRMGRAGRARVQRDLSWDRVAERMAPVLEDLGVARRADEGYGHRDALRAAAA
jgi:glycosyltransferase involved in cell wall biosynthesis